MTQAQTTLDKKILEEMLRRTKEDGGFTFDLRRNEFVSKQTGYFVSLQGYEENIYSPFLSYIVPQYLQKHQYILTHKGNYLGCWVDTYTYLDVSVHASTIYEAIKLAKQHKQKGIYDNLRKQTILMDSFKASSRDGLHDGLQKYSVEETYPLTVSYRGDILNWKGEVFVWNAISGQTLWSEPFDSKQRFERTNSFGHRVAYSIMKAYRDNN